MNKTPLNRYVKPARPKPRKCRIQADGCHGSCPSGSNGLSRRDWCENEACVAGQAARMADKIQAARDREKRKREAAYRRQRKTEKEAVRHDRRWWLASTQEACNKAARVLRGDMPCISCGVAYGKFNGGHFLSVAARPDLRYCLSNIWPQCEQCNSSKSGNANLYRISLVGKIGPELVEQMEHGLRGRSDWTIEDLREIREYYREMVKG